MWSSLTSSAASIYYNASLVFLLRSCHQSPQRIQESETEDASDENNVDLSDYLNEGLNWLFGKTNEEKVSHLITHMEPYDECQDIIHTSFGGSVSLALLIKILLGFLFAIIGFCFAVVLIRRTWKKERLCNKKKPADDGTLKDIANSNTSKNSILENQKEIEVDSIGAGAPEQQTCITAPPALKSSLPIVISLPHSNNTMQALQPSSLVSKPDSAQFLTYTVDHLLTQLDWMLGLAVTGQPSPANEPMSSAAASLVTPRFQRKGNIRRPRWRTMTSVPFGAVNISPDDKTIVRMWQKVEEMARRMNWKQLDVGELDINSVQDSCLSAVLQFYQQTCPVRAEQWSVSCLIVNYVLALIEHELCAGCSERDPLQVFEFCSFGSAASETCITTANRFNVMLVLLLPFASDMSVYHCDVCDEVPAGKLVLQVKESSVTGRISSLLQKDHIGNTFGSFLSAREVVKATQRLVSNAVDRLKLKNKFLLDRLSFSMHLAQYNDLVLCIDTKMLNGLGLGLSEITVHLTPALRVSSPETSPLPSLYAVPPWNSLFIDTPDSVRNRLQSRIMRNRIQDVPPDLLWQLNVSELSRSFMESTKNKLASVGISSCQVMCQQILRALFSRSGKDTLLTTGELHPHVLDSVVFFLLLESPPSSWSLSCLPDRLSDCVHFLKSAVQSAWMPGFTIHNPHLVKQMPALQLLPLLTTSRQENILANIGVDAVDNILGFMDSRLQETGLKRCIKEDYSTEMWEYEFFIFG